MALLIPARFALSLLVATLSLQDPPRHTVSEHDLKAAYLYNFARFVTWPPDVPPVGEPFRLCVVAEITTTQAVEHTMTGEILNGRPVHTLVPETADDVRTCQILFVGRGAGDRARTMLAAVRQLPVLTVGESAGFVDGGGIIEFVNENSRVRFDINPRNAERAGLTISARLLRVARRVERPHP